jgi:hypothetical protein
MLTPFAMWVATGLPANQCFGTPVVSTGALRGVIEFVVCMNHV